jgi:peptidoglycan/LPS O-acetylase OafA/YrhL
VSAGTQLAGRTRRTYRPEIEGLRAIAAFLVVIFHVFIGKVSGGVDVFFVVAGFLITLILVDQVLVRGGLQPGRYFSRLASRLLPMSILVLLAVSAAILLLAPLWYQSPWMRQVGWSALYVENWSLAGESVEYLNKAAPASPVQQFWALSIQGQFYVIWILLFALALLVGRMLTRVPFTRVITVVLVVAFAGSFAYSVQAERDGSLNAYFHTGTRVWEFAAGGLLALAIMNGRRFANAVAVPAGWIGLALLLTCGVMIGAPSNFPGWAALWPVAGAVLILMSGDSRTPSRLSVTRLLGSRPLVWAGAFSYALYLWHWPILVFYRLRTGTYAITALPGILIIISAVVLAYITTRLLDDGFRSRVLAAWSARRILSVGGLCLVMLASAAFVLGWSRSNQLADVVGDPRSAYVSNLASAREDYPLVYRNECVQDLSESEVTLCEAGDPDGDTTVMLIGGSHTAHWFPAVDLIAQERGWKLITALKDACRFTLVADESSIGGPSCHQWNESLLAKLEAEPPAMVITTSTVSDGRGEFTPDGYVDQWRRLDALGIDVIGIRDTPRWMKDPVDCLWAHPDDMAACSVPRSQSLADRDPAALRGDLPSNVTLIDVDDLICDGDTCPAVRDGVVVYWDLSHLSATFAASLAEEIAEGLPSASP